MPISSSPRDASVSGPSVLRSWWIALRSAARACSWSSSGHSMPTSRSRRCSAPGAATVRYASSATHFDCARSALASSGVTPRRSVGPSRRSSIMAAKLRRATGSRKRHAARADTERSGNGKRTPLGRGAHAVRTLSEPQRRRLSRVHRAPGRAPVRAPFTTETIMLASTPAPRRACPLSAVALFSDTRAILPTTTVYAPPNGASPGGLTERFALERELGGAGPCRVLLARERATGCVVVVKALGGASDPTEPAERARFEREIALTARLRHPNLIDVLDAGITRDGCLFYTMPFVAGETLRERIARDGPLPVCESLRIARALAHALHHTHRRGIVHRDVKPANVLLEAPDGDARHAASRPVLIDFGIACTFDDSSVDEGVERITATGLLVG